LNARNICQFFSKIYTNSQSKAYRDGEEEATQAYMLIRRGDFDEANKGRRMNPNW